MCGSGTILIEAGLIAHNVAPGLIRVDGAAVAIGGSGSNGKSVSDSHTSIGSSSTGSGGKGSRGSGSKIWPFMSWPDFDAQVCSDHVYEI